MKYESYYDEYRDCHVLKLEFHGGDLVQAEFSENGRAMIRLLEKQQLEDPTGEGALMIAQLYVAAIERGRASVNG